MKSFILLFTILLCVSLQSCDKANAEEVLRQAESDLQVGRIDMAVNGCKTLVDSTSTTLSSTQMCRVAIIYAKVSELSDSQDYMATATECYERAVTLDQDTDSLSRYIDSLDEESQSVVREIRELAQALNSPCDYTLNTSDEDEEDYVDMMEQNDLSAANQQQSAI